MHAAKHNKNAFKALIAAEYTGVEVKWADNFEMGVSNKTPEFLKMNPIGKVCFLIWSSFLRRWECFIQFIYTVLMLLKVPVLETPDGPVFESNAIARYGEGASDIWF